MSVHTIATVCTVVALWLSSSDCKVGVEVAGQALGHYVVLRGTAGLVRMWDGKDKPQTHEEHEWLHLQVEN